MEMNSISVVWQDREIKKRRIANSQELASLYFDFSIFGGEMENGTLGGNGLSTRTPAIFLRRRLSSPTPTIYHHLRRRLSSSTPAIFLHVATTISDAYYHLRLSLTLSISLSLFRSLSLRPPFRSADRRFGRICGHRLPPSPPDLAVQMKRERR